MYLFIIDLTQSQLQDGRETFSFSDLLQLILEVWR